MNQSGIARLLEVGPGAGAKSDVLKQVMKQTLTRAAYDLASVGMVDVREVTNIG